MLPRHGLRHKPLGAPGIAAGFCLFCSALLLAGCATSSGASLASIGAALALGKTAGAPAAPLEPMPVPSAEAAVQAGGFAFLGSDIDPGPSRAYAWTAASGPSPSDSASGARHLSAPGATKAERARRAAAAKAEVSQRLDDSKPASPESFAARGDGAPDLAARAEEIARRRHGEAVASMKADERAEFLRLAPGSLGYDSIAPNSRLASSLSLAVAASVSYLDKPDFFVALAAAAYAMDPGNPNGANNLASAIVTRGERLHAAALEPFRADAESLYRRAIALSLNGAAFSAASKRPLLNYGNLLVDMRRIGEARSAFLAVRAMERGSWEGACGLAACWVAEGRRDLAAALLDDEELDKPAAILAAAAGGKVLEDTDGAAELTPESADEEFEAAIAGLAEAPTITSADFAAGLDQGERNKMRFFLDNLPVKGSFQAPKIAMLSQFSTLKSISEPLGQGALMDFIQAMSFYDLKAAASQSREQLEMAERLGLKVDLGFDPADAAAHPEKYENYEPAVAVSGEAAVQANAADMAEEAKKAQRDLATGKTSSTLALAARIDPAFTILRIDPNRYADPGNVIVQRLNFQILARKMNAYEAYLFKANRRTYETIAEVSRLAYDKIKTIHAGMDSELAVIEAQKEAAARAGLDTDTPSWRLKTHAVHDKAFTAMNEVATVAWNQCTEAAYVSYQQVIKPNAEALYYDVLRHVALISDPEIRASKDRSLEAALDRSVAWGLDNVLRAYLSFHYANKWDCDCDIAQLNADRDAERAALEAEEKAHIREEVAARKRFESGEVPESSPLFKKLDAFGTDLKIPGIPFLSGRISCARTVMNLAADFPLPGMPSLSYGFASNNFTGATTHSGGLSLGFGAEKGGLTAGARLSLSGSVTTDGSGVVSDYSVKVGATVGVSGAKGELGAGGELSFGPGGATSSDFSVSAKTDLSTAIGGASLSAEASAVRGCSLSAEVQQTIGPLQDLLDQGAAETLGEGYADASPAAGLLEKDLWSGSFSL